MAPMVEAALLRYLAVAHFGRGRGQWTEGEAPAHWRSVVQAALQPHADALQALWQSRGTRFEAGSDAERLAAELLPRLRAAAIESLERLYPGQWTAAPAAESQAEPI
jgi:hypothetical protein